MKNEREKKAHTQNAQREKSNATIGTYQVDKFYVVV